MDCNSLSASSTKCWEDCHFKYYLEKVLRIPQEKKWATENGTFCHSIFEQLAQQLKEGKEPEVRKNWKRQLIEAYRSTRTIKNKFGAEEQIPPLWELSAKALERQQTCDSCRWFKKNKCFIVGKKPEDFKGCPVEEFESSIWMIEKVLEDDSILNPLNKKILDTERGFKILVDDGAGTQIPVTGFIDLVVELDEESIEINDYKTGKWVQSYKECLEDPQLLYYHLAARELYPNKKHVFITLWYLQRRMMTFAFTPEDDERTKQRVIKTYHEIKNNQFPERRCDRPNGFVKFDWKCTSLCTPTTCQREYEKMIKDGCVSEGKSREITNTGK